MVLGKPVLTIADISQWQRLLMPMRLFRGIFGTSFIGMLDTTT
jgi:hypothetical protein